MFRERSIAELSNLPVREFSAALQTLRLAGREPSSHQIGDLIAVRPGERGANRAAPEPACHPVLAHQAPHLEGHHE
jgi:hypothetical protein